MALSGRKRVGILRTIVAFSCASLAAYGQFKEIKAAPFSPAVARQRIRTLLENVNAENRDQTVATISGWLDWYRDILDEELIARWKGPARSNLTAIMAPLADDRVAREVVEFSWHTDRAATFTPAYAPLLGDLMTRYRASSAPFLNDLLPAPVDLTPAEAEAVCRILLDAPDIDTWRKSALQILPRYRAVADRLLKQDVANPDEEKSYRAQRWRSDLKLDPPPPVTSQKFNTRAPVPMAVNQTPADLYAQRPHLIAPPSVAAYDGPMSGTFQSSGDPIPQNGEYVFTNIPPVNLLLDFDTRHWEARLEPAEGGTQNLILRNKGKGSQKRVVVHWSVQP
jgi:hypothetical protein